ncbi:hypothetical protein ACJMK2_040828 [Sinanodonta woodiana]|uniref:protein-tyrosine-phosphatase n=1 Tax=Sinanodonta woodiana TaxID=1069815 RepID=A0ABD3W295_SINWO
MDEHTLNTIPRSSRRKDQCEEVKLDALIYAQPNKINISSRRPEIDETKVEYMNSNDSSKDYYSFTPQKVKDKHTIRVDDLSSFFLSRKMEPGLYEEDYNKLPNGLTKSHDVALRSENKSKNRYKNIYPYDETRVTLEIWDPNIENDYINACYINGFKTLRAYIAAQGPTKSILNDFWRMIWQTKCSKIVMLTNLVEEGKHKCEQYWPHEGSVEYGDIVIRLIQCETFSDFTIRTLELRKTVERREEKKQTRQVKQFHFTAWPDRGVPRFASSLVHFRHKIHATKTRENSEGPIVVHCSAGIGRTGTFLALDYLVDQAEETGYINVVNCVENLRKQRVNLVQTLEQYIFVHEALVEALTCTTIAMSTSEFQENYRTLLERDTKTRKRKLDDAFEKLPMYVSDPGEDVYVNAKDTENRDKNRYSNILPDKNHCPYLNVYVKGRDAYINAVFLPAYKLNDIFIITQTPLENTIVDFWRMVYQLEVSSIVMLNTLSQMKEEERYWTENEETLEILPFRITLESKTSDDICTNYTMLLKYHDERRRVHLSRATYWADRKNVPNSPTAMLKQIDLIQGWQQETGNKPIVVHCMNGADRSGLFCVIAALLERTKIEQDVAVEQIIKQMRSRRPQIIPNVDQFKFCYDAVSAYLDQFDTYSNFAGL